MASETLAVDRRYLVLARIAYSQQALSTKVYLESSKLYSRHILVYWEKVLQIEIGYELFNVT